MTIELFKLSEPLLNQTLQLSVNENQRPYTSTVSATLKHLNPCQHPHVITLNKIPIGFFVIDFEPNAILSRRDPATVILRSFFIDRQYQRRGYAKTALTKLTDYMNQHHATIRTVALTVNCRNKSAYHCYQSAGFVDKGEYYLDGPIGPQHIMQLHI
jgi:GNAT superfamily N-acetyltransferase